MDPGDILIFKMRGVKAKKRQAARAPARPGAAPAAAGVAGAAAPAAAEAPKEAAPVVQAQKRERKPFFAQKPKAARVQAESPAPARAEAPEQIQIPEMPEPQEETMLSQDEAERLQEIRNLEEMALYAAPDTGPATGHVQHNAFIKIGGVLFLVNAILFAYFILPQSSFVLGYMSKIGLGAFLASWNYEYGSAVVNMVLVLLSAASGALLLVNMKRSHLMGGTAGALLMLIVSYEYLNSGAAYLLMITLLSFVCIVSIVYARMSAVIATETETETPERINWPRIETF